MRVLGIDPGTRIVGFGVVDYIGNRITPIVFGALNVIKEKDFSARLKKIYEGLTQIITEQHPDVVAIEEVFFSRNAQSAIKIGEGRGVAILSAANAGIQVEEYAATEVKKAVVGNGGAQKSQVQEMVRRLLGLEKPPEPEDASDALALAICHCHRQRLQNLINPKQ